MTTTFISVASEGGGAHAIDVMARLAQPLCRTMSRAIPFLGRRGVSVQHEAPVLTATAEVCDGLVGPAHEMHLVVEPGGGRARLCFDAEAIAFLLDGTLCGDGSGAKALEDRLTLPQRAFITELGASVSKCLSATFEREAGLSLRAMPAVENDRTTNAAMVCMTLTFVEAQKAEAPAEDDFSFDEVEEEEEDADQSEAAKPRGTVRFAISKSTLMAARLGGEPPKETTDLRVVHSVEEVPVDVIAELGRITMSVAEIGALRVGDTMRLPVAVNGAVNVRVEDVALFHGRPTTSGSQLAVELTGAALESQTAAGAEVPTSAPA